MELNNLLKTMGLVDAFAADIDLPIGGGGDCQNGSCSGSCTSGCSSGCYTTCSPGKT
jgi:hypothetical protein